MLIKINDPRSTIDDIAVDLATVDKQTIVLYF